MGRYLWKIWFIVLSIFSLHASQKTVWILIHGTWAQKQPWYRVGGDFYEKLRQCLDMQKNNIISFTWNGNVRHTSRVEAARQLASYLETYQNDTDINIVAHSHGANVGILASQMMAQKNYSQKKINYFFALGVPVNNVCYYPAMEIVDYFYNIFSYEDLIQPVFGLFQREYAPHDRIINMRATINDEQPDHTTLHDPCLAQWLPSLHDLYMKSEKQEPNAMVLHLYDKKFPLCMIDKHRDQLRERDIKTQQLIASVMRSPWMYEKSYKQELLD